ncbi:RNA degradosome polyphosphate kinase [Commensalibacter papalotli (ex Botero et al. 2024)]|uniref:Polyphosphate kinase n=1 Tax=Commensalibacter papalotli (ex Botero et al. 2024) TaxID=2972766 RepID=A0ABN8W628_9PROT|nr:RNA degradosome polyphosphate kinase [Commensalibacter papalotli (ex Botero et al. 2024)]CAI3924467.1 Polyphosphate kinase (Ppk) (PDB:1XDO) [Commensalibacter papalotli (ex Botero et al. 2024)]CAI3927588.1 Polyphosphate kinase (Ppk) (PDB:1XDO) [Commensalibacter papalotli (ex Botero et al. 2024)]
MTPKPKNVESKPVSQSVNKTTTVRTRKVAPNRKVVPAHTKPEIVTVPIKKSPERFINRELSWLGFNQRVVEEAQNIRNPLLERLRFLSISASNLDEFYSVRVAGLAGQVREKLITSSPDGLTPAQQMAAIRERVKGLFADQQDTYTKLKQLLAETGIVVSQSHDLTHDDLSWLKTYFLERIFPILTPIALDPAHPVPFIPNLNMALALRLISQRNDRNRKYVLILLPSQLPRFVALPISTKHPKIQRFVLLEDIITQFISIIFPGYKIGNYGLLRVIRDTDVEFEEEAEDLVRSYETALKRRRRGVVIHLDIDNQLPSKLADMVAHALEVPPEEVTVHHGLLGMVDVKQLIVDNRPDLLFPYYKSLIPARIRECGGDIFTALRSKDLLVYHPFESFDVVVQFLRQAAQDPQVLAIKQTLYRTSSNSPIVRALIEAAESGKSVTAIVELRARFDEEANIRLSRDLEAAGVQVVFGFADWKTHAKLSLVVRKEGNVIRTYAHFGTGNYHPITAKIYTDLSYFTCNPKLTRDAAKLFNYVTGYARPSQMESIAFSPLTIRKTLNELIDQEIDFVKAGKAGSIWLKINSLVDPRLIDRLYEASCAGVKISIIVRGICCLRPGVIGLSENIKVKSIVGRFLEHARIFVFGNGHELPSKYAKVYMSSADWMERNMDRRIEEMIPIIPEEIHDKVLNQLMVANLKDNLQSWRLDHDKNWRRVEPTDKPFSAHEYFMENPSLTAKKH